VLLHDNCYFLNTFSINPVHKKIAVPHTQGTAILTGQPDQPVVFAYLLAARIFSQIFGEVDFLLAHSPRNFSSMGWLASVSNGDVASIHSLRPICLLYSEKGASSPPRRFTFILTPNYQLFYARLLNQQITKNYGPNSYTKLATTGYIPSGYQLSSSWAYSRIILMLQNQENHGFDSNKLAISS